MTDISKNTILVLVILTIAISLLGVYTVMTEVGNLNSARTISSAQPGSTPTADGRVEISIVEPPELPHVSGQVTLSIIDKEDR